jgi:predicted nucleotidyltransferase
MGAQMYLTQKKILETFKKNYAYLSREYGLKRIGIFGSYATGSQNESSDIDIIAEFESPIGLRFIEFTEYLEHILGKKTDVLTPAGIDGIRNPKISQKIKETIIYV